LNEFETFGQQNTDVEDTTQRDQLRELERRITKLQEDVIRGIDLGGGNITSTDIVPALVNLADNTDFIYSDEAYNSTAYADDEDVLAQWYGRTQATVSSYVENAVGAEAADSIRASSHGSGARTGFEWNTTEGSLILTGGYRVATRLFGKFASSGNYFAVRFQISATADGIIDPNIKAKVSIWDNTDNEILTGTAPQLTSNKVGLHTGGTVTRQYILEVQMPDGRRFFSDTSVFTTGQNQVINSVPRTSIDADDYVNISWPSIVGSSRYRIYTRTPAEADTNWYLLTTISNGSTSTRDNGGTGGGVWTVPSFDDVNKQFSKAEAFFDDIGELLQVGDDINEVSFGIQIPSTFSPNGNQFLQIEFLKDDYSDTTTTEIPADGIRIDHVGISTTNGRWVPSSRDLQISGAITPDPPPSGGGTGDNPPSGGGSETCITLDTPVLTWSDDGNHKWLPAGEVAIGDSLVCWDGKQLAPTIVYKVVNGISRKNYLVYTDENELNCSFSHRLVTDFNDFERGTRIGLGLRQTLCYKDGEIYMAEVQSVETIEDLFRVVTFQLTKGKRNFIAGGFVSHNRKNDEPIF
jgi:hypothetical protein